MKVAMLGWEFPPFMAGGLGIHCLELTTGLARRGVQIDFYMPHMTSIEGGLRVAEHHGHLAIHEVEADPGISPYGARRGYEEGFNEAVALYNQRLVEAFSSRDADLIHCHDWITVPAALELRRRTGLPLVLTMHSTEWDRSAGFAPQPWIEQIEAAGVRGADRTIAVSRYTKSLLVSNYGADPARVVPVHNGVDLAKFRGARPPRREGAGTVLFLSRLSRQKGPLFFLKAARKVLDRRPDARFVVAGKGEMLGECIEYALAHGMGSSVRFTGFVPTNDLASFYAAHDVYVLPSVSEPFGISVLEAMASGLPTIVSKTCGVGEALGHVLRADFWDTDEVADQVLGLLSSPDLREELGRNGLREAHRFTWDASCDRTIAVYRSVAKGGAT
jgi:glycogen synthase